MGLARVATPPQINVIGTLIFLVAVGGMLANIVHPEPPRPAGRRLGAQARGGVLQAVVAPEGLAVHQDRGDARDAGRDGGVGRRPQALLQLGALGRPRTASGSSPAARAASRTASGSRTPRPAAKFSA